MRYIIDTNIWVKLLRKQKTVKSCLEKVLREGDEIIVTPVEYFELLRGLEKRRDRESIEFIKRFWARLQYIEVSREIWDEAIRLWVSAVNKNEKREDADTLLAAFASKLRAILVTENVKHFLIFNLKTENWAK